jgi:hypothetical protein
MKMEIVPFGMMICACGAMLYSVHHLHPECTPGKDWCELRMVHLKDGHEREPVPMDTRARATTMTVTSSVGAFWRPVGTFPRIG